jgi:hypothetical protein
LGHEEGEDLLFEFGGVFEGVKTVRLWATSWA